jgi:hypothetical protein
MRWFYVLLLIILFISTPCFGIDNIAITTSSLGALTQGTLSSGTFTATGGDDSYQWSILEPIPDDFAVDINGAWTFTPMLYGYYSITITVVDGLGNTGNKVFTGTIENDGSIDMPQVLEFSMPETSSSLTVPITVFKADDTVNAFAVTMYPAKLSKADDRWTVNAWTEILSTTDGEVTFYPWVKNSYGEINMGDPETVTITVDPGELPPPPAVDLIEMVQGDKTLTINTD